MNELRTRPPKKMDNVFNGKCIDSNHGFSGDILVFGKQETSSDVEVYLQDVSDILFFGKNDETPSFCRLYELKSLSFR